MQADHDRRPIAAAVGGTSREETNRIVEYAFLLVAIAGLLIARIPVMPVRFFDPDELQHTHAAWSVFRGLLPYRDFFEHHTPWYYFALAPFFRWFAVDQSFESAKGFLVFARGVSLVLTLLSAALMFFIGRLAWNRRVGLLAALFLIGQPVVIQKTLEIRPDVLALPFYLGALWFLVRGLREDDDAAPARPSLGWFFGGGLCLGAAIMCTQKMLFVLPGALTGLGLWVLAGRRPLLPARTLALLAAGAGMTATVGLTWLGFALQGGGGQFIHNNFILNAKWRLHAHQQLLVTLETSWPILLLCLAAASASMVRFFRGRERRYGDVLLLCTMGGLIAGILVMPVAHRQYYLMPLPIACLFAAKGFSSLVDMVRERARTWLLVCATLPLLIWPIVDLRSSYARREDGRLERLHYVFEHTRPTDLVLDGWLGTGLFRPHPLYYFFLHAELLAMMSEQDRDACMDVLEGGTVRPALIALDDNLVALGSRFVRFLHKNYVSDDGLFYRPRPGLGQR